MTSRRQPSGKGKERREPVDDREDDMDEDYDFEEKLRRPKDNRILCFIPNDGIDYNVIRTEVPEFLGPEASVSRGKHPKNERPGYYIRAYSSISIGMISDLKMDTIRWSDEMRVSNNRDYRLSNTHRMRQKSGPTPEPSASPPTTAPTSQYRHDKGGESRSIPSDAPSQTSETAYVDTYHGRVDIRGQQPQIDYDKQMRSTGPYTRPDAQGAPKQAQDSRSLPYAQGATKQAQDSRSLPYAQGATKQAQDSRSLPYAQPSTNIYIQTIQQTHTTAATISSPAAQPTYTRQEVEKIVAQKLRDQGYKEITRPLLDKAVDQFMRALQQDASSREDRSTSVPPPLTEHPGGTGQPRPSQPSTTGTRGFESKYATSGADYRRH